MVKLSQEDNINNHLAISVILSGYGVRLKDGDFNGIYVYPASWF